MAKKRNVKRATARPRAQPRARLVRQPQMRTGDYNLAKAVCSNSNPFCPEAYGAKYYDENSVRSLTYQERTLFSLDTDAAGTCAYAFSMGARAARSQGTVVAGTITAWGAYADTNFYGTAAAGEYRVVSAGFRYRTTQPWTEAKGVLVIQEHPNDPTSVTTIGVGNLRQGSNATMFAVRDADVYFIHKPQGMFSTSYTPIGNTGALSSWSSAVVGIVGGAASANAGYIEVITNYEYTAVASTAYSTMATPAAPSVPTVMQARAVVLGATPPIGKTTTTHDSTWMSDVMGVLKRIAPTAMTMAFGPEAGLLTNAFLGTTGGRKQQGLLTNG